VSAAANPASQSDHREPLMPLANLHATSADSALFRRRSRCVGRVPTYARMRTRAHTELVRAREHPAAASRARGGARRELVRCIPDSATRPAESPVKKGK